MTKAEHAARALFYELSVELKRLKFTDLVQLKTATSYDTLPSYVKTALTRIADAVIKTSLN